jgi:peptidoglycan/xylan/chitin deacetylase (PgdA/CDA1 family)
MPQTSDKLYQFLQQNDQHATHFFIGTNILENPKEFLTAFQTLQDDIAFVPFYLSRFVVNIVCSVHTWTHPYMTTLSNLDIVAQFGWTMELIHNSTGGRLPKFWRPPYGDTDVRVKAIAHEIFGMTTILWNQECVSFIYVLEWKIYLAQ